jgi:hypothetical protein
MIKINCATCGREIINPTKFQKNCSRECSRKSQKEYQKAYHKTDKCKAYKKEYYLRKKDARRL